MFVEGIYQIPEARQVTPGHLVRCGHSSAYDVNFGKESGAAGVMLLKKGVCGVTIVGVSGKQVRYLKTELAIKQKHVDLDQVALHEALGICFGRNKKKFSPELKEIKNAPERYM